MTTEEAEAKAADFNVMFIETSAKAGHNVKTLFKKIAQALPGMDKAGEGEQSNKSEWDAVMKRLRVGYDVFWNDADSHLPALFFQ